MIQKHILKDYYKILRVSKLAGQEEIKRSYRKLVSKYHPDINPSPDAHAILIEINEAYGVLSDVTLKNSYDQLLNFQFDAFINETISTTNVDPRKRRHGKKETAEEREQKRLFAIRRNRSFNKKMKMLSIVSFLLGGFIFLDHYLPSELTFQKAHVGFNKEKVSLFADGYNIFLNEKRIINLIPIRKNEEAVALLEGEVLVSSSPLLGVIENIQIGKFVFKPLEGLFDLMLIYGLVCLASIFVIFYKLENSLVLPTIITFFSNILVLAFFILWLTE